MYILYGGPYTRAFIVEMAMAEGGIVAEVRTIDIVKKEHLSPEFLETEAAFLERKSEMALVGDVKTFENFIVSVPPSVDLDAYSAVIIWCESFDQFITAARYR